jgi:hypothetical protein
MRSATTKAASSLLWWTGARDRRGSGLDRQLGSPAVDFDRETSTVNDSTGSTITIIIVGPMIGSSTEPLLLRGENVSRFERRGNRSLSSELWGLAGFGTRCPDGVDLRTPVGAVQPL